MLGASRVSFGAFGSLLGMFSTGGVLLFGPIFGPVVAQKVPDIGLGGSKRPQNIPNKLLGEHWCSGVFHWVSGVI